MPQKLYGGWFPQLKSKRFAPRAGCLSDASNVAVPSSTLGWGTVIYPSNKEYSMNNMRSKHGPEDHVSQRETSDGTIRLTCTDGWIYDTHPSFVEAVITRHKHEAFLP
jgi:hypothetical protein